MSTSAHQRIFLWQCPGEEALETVFSGGVLSPGVRRPGAVVHAPGAAERVRSGVGSVLRFTGRLILFSPALILPKLLLPGRTIADYLTVLFVIVVVLFFAALNVYFLVSFVWWARRLSGASVRFAEAKDLIDEKLAVPAERAARGTMVRVEGLVVPLVPCDVVLRSANVDAPMLARLVEMTAFAVVPERGLPVVVTSDRMPMVEANSEPIDLPPAATGLLPLGAVLGECSAIRPGDSVVVIGTVDRVVENSDHFDLDGETASLPRGRDGEQDPYRAGPGGPAIVIGSQVLVRKVA